MLGVGASRWARSPKLHTGGGKRWKIVLLGKIGGERFQERGREGGMWFAEGALKKVYVEERRRIK